MSVDFVLAKYIYLIGDFPPLPQVLLEPGAEVTLFQTERKFWKMVSLWLRHLMLGEALLSKAYEGKAIYCLHNAEWFKELFGLIVAVYSRSGNPNIKAFSSPALLWYHCCWVSAQRELQDAGVTGLPPEIVPKREAYKAVSGLCSDLEKLLWVPDDPYPFEEYPEATIFLEAQAIAKGDSRFRNRVFRPFLKNWRYLAKYVKECKHLQSSYLLPDGTVFTTGKDRKLPSGL